MSLNVNEQECNGGKKYGQKGTLCGPNTQYSTWLVKLCAKKGIIYEEKR